MLGLFTWINKPSIFISFNHIFHEYNGAIESLQLADFGICTSRSPGSVECQFLRGEQTMLPRLCWICESGRECKCVQTRVLELHENRVVMRHGKKAQILDCWFFCGRRVMISSTMIELRSFQRDWHQKRAKINGCKIPLNAMAIGSFRGHITRNSF